MYGGTLGLISKYYRSLYTCELVLFGSENFTSVFDPDTDLRQGQHCEHHYYALGQQGQLKMTSKPKIVFFKLL